jgi:hypothetical protein
MIFPGRGGWALGKIKGMRLSPQILIWGVPGNHHRKCSRKMKPV